QRMNAYQQQHSSRLNKILTTLPKDGNETLRRFVMQFYSKVPITDLEHYDPKRALALATSAFEFSEKRKTGEPKIRIFMPDKKEHGYEGRYIVVELLNDDMPFLVDSLTAELTRHGFTIRETLHPIINVKRSKDGKLEAMDDKGQAESFIHFEISAL